MEKVCCVLVEKSHVKKVKTALESVNMLQKEFRITEITLNNIRLMAVPVSFGRVVVDENDASVDRTVRRACGVGSVHFIDKNLLLKTKCVRPQQLLFEYCSVFLDGRIAENIAFDKVELLTEIPMKWERHGDMVMFSGQAFRSNVWHFPDDRDFWSGVARKLGANRVALMSTISNDDYRTPQVQMKYGVDGWVEHMDNGIKYMYDVTKNMFSKGNISEKLRISQLDCHNEVVVDLFAGIGYFTLPYLLKAGARTVYACEWNANAVDALRKNLLLNNVDEDRCVVLHGDNRMVAPKNIAERVNLGLIPTSSASWLAACKCLKLEKGGWLHIHENIDSGPNIDRCCTCGVSPCIVRSKYDVNIDDKKCMVWCSFVMQTLKAIVGHFFSFTDNMWTVTLERVIQVKSFAPHVDHVVLDILCSPPIAVIEHPSVS